MKKNSPPVMRRRQIEHNKTQEMQGFDKIMKTLNDMKEEMGILRKSMDKHEIHIKGDSDSKQGKGNYLDTQKPNFAGIAKKIGKVGKSQSQSLVPDRELSITDSDEEKHDEHRHNMLVMVEPKRAPINYRSMNEICLNVSSG